MNEWQQMETAPTDGSIIVLLGDVGFGPCEAFAKWVKDKWQTPDGLTMIEPEGWRGKMFQYEKYLLLRGLNYHLRTKASWDD